MLVVLWIAVGIGVLAPAFALVSIVRSGLRAWRDFRGSSGALSAALSDLTVRLERFAGRTGARSAEVAELAEGQARLQSSLAQLAVLRAAVDEARDAARRVTVFYPRK